MFFFETKNDSIAAFDSDYYGDRDWPEVAVNYDHLQSECKYWELKLGVNFSALRTLYSSCYEA